jgi:MFS family permease
MTQAHMTQAHMIQARYADARSPLPMKPFSTTQKSDESGAAAVAASPAISVAALAQRLPFYYGWVVVAVVFVTMAIGVNARTAFSLLFPPILGEFGWAQGVTAGAFSFGFLIAAVLSPALGRLMDRHGPRVVMELGVVIMAAGLLLATRVHEPWQLYATLGLLVGGGSVCLGFTGQSLFLPHWFARRRGLAMSIAFCGVGAGSILMLPWIQAIIERAGWRAACAAMGLLVLAVLAPLNLLLRRRPEELGLCPDGDGCGLQRPAAVAASANAAAVGAPDEEWTLARALRTPRFWWIALGFFDASFAWYAVQVHQTKYLIEVGFSAQDAAWSLGAVSLAAIPGQIVLGHLSDRIGREMAWTIGCLGFALCYVVLLLLWQDRSAWLLYLAVIFQGSLGYGLISVMGAIPAEIFHGKHYGTIYGSLSLAAIAGGAAGPWLTGFLHDLTQRYTMAFAVAIFFCAISTLAIWRAAPSRAGAVEPSGARCREGKGAGVAAQPHA